HLAHWAAIRADHVNVGIAGLRAIECDPFAIRRPARTPEGNSIERDQLRWIETVGVTNPKSECTRTGGGEYDLFAVRRELGFQIRLGGCDKPRRRTFIAGVGSGNAPDIGVERNTRIDQAIASTGD